MEDKIDTLFQHWNKYDSKVLVSEAKNIEPISVEALISESTKYCRYSGRLTWILIDWLIRNIDKVNESKLLDLTKTHGDITVLGLISDLASQKRKDSVFDHIISTSKPNKTKEIFFYRIAKSKIASKIAVENSLPVYERWNFYCNELTYLTTNAELQSIGFR
ncbi:MAG: hypothetical protein HQL05_07655 [Nitrospirae bacterium]|uniref:hypothetical protein n=1 Tax=Candidatus Magnetobacterium casense TaxID=1455061 RepID=UPI00058E1723|nr:hypothetical protein [Candidatus Magnetobacterium casensis]MBF0337694.1 hypothetical protein [Nitrospirota bacterium]